MCRASLTVTLTYSNGNNKCTSISKKLKTHGSLLTETPMTAAKELYSHELSDEEVWIKLCCILSDKIRDKGDL
jgi:hypothetical protein